MRAETLKKGRYIDRGNCQKGERLQILYQDGYNKGTTGYPLSLFSKGENVLRFPSMLKGENVEYGCH